MDEQAGEYRFEGMLESDGLSGEVTIMVKQDALVFTAPAGLLACLYSDICAFAIRGYTLVIDTQYGKLRLSQMGDALEWLFDKLWDAYNDAVQKALFVDGPPIYESRGEYRYDDAGGCSEGIACVRLFGNCVLILPPNEEARRIPLCFVREMKEGDYALRLTLDTGETYTFLRLAGYKQGFAYQLTQCLKALQNKAMESVREICASVNSMQLTMIARLLPEGVAAPIGTLFAISPAFVDAVERQIMHSRAAEPYAFFKQACNARDICVGLKPYMKREDADTLPQAAEAQPSEEKTSESPFVIFIAAPKANENGGVAAVELAIPEEDSAATFIYRYQGEWGAFSRKLNRAMEAVSFRREVIWMKEEALCKSENAHYLMAIKRTEALRFLRGCFAGRVIHAEAWQRDMEKKFKG